MLLIFINNELNFVLKQETEWEIDTSIKAQKIITKLIEEQINESSN